MKKILVIITTLTLIILSTFLVAANSNVSKGLMSDSKVILSLLAKSMNGNKQLDDSDMAIVDGYIKRYRGDIASKEYASFSENEKIIIDDVWLAYIDYRAYYGLNGNISESKAEKEKSREFYRKEILKINDTYQASK
jgi:hypothetical protein